MWSQKLALKPRHPRTATLRTGDRLRFASGSIVQVLELYRDGAYARLGYVVGGRLRGELENIIEMRCDHLLAGATRV